MELKTYDDILQLHVQLGDRVNKQLLSIRRGSKLTGEAIITATRAGVKDAAAAIEALERAKAAQAKRLDDEIARNKTAMERLERELERLEKQATEEARPAKPVRVKKAVRKPSKAKK